MRRRTVTESKGQASLPFRWRFDNERDFHDLSRWLKPEDEVVRILSACPSSPSINDSKWRGNFRLLPLGVLKGNGFTFPVHFHLGKHNHGQKQQERR
jgi:hypothetical protein